MKRIWSLLSIWMTLTALLVIAGPHALAQTDIPPNGYNLLTECTQDGTSYDTWLEQNFPGASYGTQKRVLMESQAWWFPTADDEHGTATGDSYGHVHTTACVPAWDPGTVETGGGKMSLHVKLEVHLGAGVPTELVSKRPANLTIDLFRLQIRGLDKGIADDILIDDFKWPAQDCVAGQNCILFLSLDQSDQVNRVTCGTPNPNNATEMKVQCSGPRIDLDDAYRYRDFDWSAVRATDGFTSDGFKQLRIFPVARAYLGGTQEANLRAILRSPLRIDLATFSQSADVAPSRNYPEASAWWINKTGSTTVPGAGGYATSRVATETNFGGAIGGNTFPTEPIVDENLSQAGFQLTLPEWSVLPQPCSKDCAEVTRELSGFRIYADPSFHNASFDEPAARLVNKAFPGSPSDCSTNPSCETDGQVGEYPLDLNLHRKVTITPGVNAPSTFGNPGLHKLVVITRQPTQKDHPDIPERDESTLFGVFVLYVTIAR